MRFLDGRSEVMICLTDDEAEVQMFTGYSLGCNAWRASDAVGLE